LFLVPGIQEVFSFICQYRKRKIKTLTTFRNAYQSRDFIHYTINRWNTCTILKNNNGFRDKLRDKVEICDQICLSINVFNSTLLFLLFLCFSRPYITFLRCLDVKPLSLTRLVFNYQTPLFSHITRFYSGLGTRCLVFCAVAFKVELVTSGCSRTLYNIFDDYQRDMLICPIHKYSLIHFRELVIY